MVAALQLLGVYLMEMLSLQRKLIAVGMVEASPLFFVLVRFYGMLQRRAQGKVEDWDWQEWLEDIEDDELRLKLRVALENDEALQSGGLPVELRVAKRRASHGVRRRHEANRAS